MMELYSNPVFPDVNWNLSLWRIMRECRAVAGRHGFTGDALTDNRRAGTLEQERAIFGLLGAIDGRIAQQNRAFTRRIIRNIVLNSGR